MTAITSGLFAFEVPYICKLKDATFIVSLSIADDGICGVAVGSGCLPVTIGNLSITVGFLI
jgi:hypothetical protein